MYSDEDDEVVRLMRGEAITRPVYFGGQNTGNYRPRTVSWQRKTVPGLPFFISPLKDFYNRLAGHYSYDNSKIYDNPYYKQFEKKGFSDVECKFNYYQNMFARSTTSSFKTGFTAIVTGVFIGLAIAVNPLFSIGAALYGLSLLGRLAAPSADKVLDQLISDPDYHSLMKIKNEDGQDLGDLISKNVSYFDLKKEHVKYKLNQTAAGKRVVEKTEVLLRGSSPQPA